MRWLTQKIYFMQLNVVFFAFIWLVQTVSSYAVAELDLDCPFDRDLCQWQTDPNIQHAFWPSKPPSNYSFVPFAPPSNQAEGFATFWCDDCHNFSLRFDLNNYVGDYMCLSFNLFAFASYRAEFHVLIETDRGESIPAFRLPRLQFDDWRSQSVQLLLNSKRFVAIKLHSSYKLIGLNRLRATTGLCLTGNLCQFDGDNWCGWERQSIGDPFHIKLINSLYITHYDLTVHDSRDNLHSGRFVSMYSTQFIKSTSAILLSPALDMRLNYMYCLSFELFQVPGSNQIVNIYIQNESGEMGHLLWSSNQLSDKHFYEWSGFHVEIMDSSAYRVVFQFVQKTKHQAPVAIDNVRLQSNNCPDNIQCDFSRDFCELHLPVSIGGRSFIHGYGRLARPDQLPINVMNVTESRKHVYADFTFDSTNPESTAIAIDSSELENFVMVSSWIRTAVRYGMSTSLSFQVAMYSVDFESIRLRVQLDHEFGQYDLWTETGNTNNTWKKVEVQFDQRSLFRLRVIAERIQGQSAGWIGLSDMRIVLRSTPQGTAEQTKLEQLSCDFSIDLCGWRNGASDRFEIVRSNDRKTHNYITIGGRMKSIDVSNSELISPTLEPNTTNKLLQFCVMFEHIISGDAELSLIVSGSSESPVDFVTTGFNDHEWRPEMVTLTNIGPTRLSFRASRTYGTVQIRNVRVHSGGCQSSTLYFHKCTFERNTCGLHALSRYTGFQLKVSQSVHNPLLQTTIKDHSLRSDQGHFWVLDLDGPNNLAPLSKPYHLVMLYDHKTDESMVCVRMWLLMQVRAHIKFVYENQASSVIHNYYSDSNWYPHQLQLPIINRRLRLSVKVFPAENSYGLIGLDDLSIERGACPAPIYDCDFELECMWDTISGSIRFVHMDGKLYRESYSSGSMKRSVASSIEFVDADHTLGESDGHVLEVHSIVKTLTYRSPRIQLGTHETDGAFCFEYWYKYEAGDKLDQKVKLTLSVALNDQSDIYVIESHEPVSNGGWKMEHVHIPLKELHAKLLAYNVSKMMDISNQYYDFLEEKNFDDDLEDSEEEADRTLGKTSLVVYLTLESDLSRVALALDDFRLLRRQCPNDHELVKSTFRCESDKSVRISIDQKCDSKMDCADGSDERDCGECEFASDHFCGYKLDSPYEDIFFMLTKELTSEGKSNTTIESLIHNQFSIEDSNSYISGFLNLFSVGSSVQLVSPIIRRTALHSKITFRYQTYGSRLSISLLRAKALNAPYDSVASLDASDPHVPILEIWSDQDDQQDESNEATTLQLGKQSQPFRIRFQFIRTAASDQIKFPQFMLSSLQRESFESLPMDHILMPQDDSVSKFDCGDGMELDWNQVCDQRRDCDNSKDETFCDFDRQGLDFNENLPNFVKLTSMRHSLVRGVKELRFLKSDHSNKSPVGGVIWMSNATNRDENESVRQFALNQNESGLVDSNLTNWINNGLNQLNQSNFKMVGRFGGFHLFNQPNCRVRFYYQLQGSQATIQLWTPNWLEKSINRRIHSLVLNKTEDWQRLDVVLYSTTIRQVFRLQINVQINSPSTIVVIDDISFTSDCYASNEKSLTSLLFSDRIIKNRYGDWTVVRLSSQLDVQTGYYRSPILATSLLPNISSFNAQPVFTIRSKMEMMSSVASFDVESMNEAILQSPKILAASLTSSGLLFRYGVVGGGRFNVKLIETVSNRLLFNADRFEASSMQSVWIALANTSYMSETISLCLHIQLQSNRAHFLIEQFQTINRTDGQNSKDSNKLCDFEQTTDCDLFTHTQINTGLIRAPRHIDQSDHTLGSRHGNFLVAGCGLQAQRQWITLIDSHRLRPDRYTISFWFTSFWISSDRMTVDRETLASGGRLRLTDLFQEPAILFEFKHNLKGEWNRALVESDLNPNSEVRLQATLIDTNSLYCVAIDDVEVKKSYNQVMENKITCNFDKGTFCAWINQGRANQARWHFSFESVQSLKLKSFRLKQQYLRSLFSAENTNESAVLITPWIQSFSAPMCLKVKLRSFPPSVNTTLHVQLQSAAGNLMQLAIITNLNQTWDQIEVPINMINRSRSIQQILIKSTPGVFGDVDSDQLISVDLASIDLSRKPCLNSNQFDAIDLQSEIVLDQNEFPISPDESLNESNQKLLHSKQHDPESSSWINRAIWIGSILAGLVAVVAIAHFGFYRFKLI